MPDAGVSRESHWQAAKLFLPEDKYFLILNIAQEAIPYPLK